MGTSFIDAYSLLHFATGIIARFWGVPFWSWFLVHVMFEWIENTTQGMMFINHYIPWFPGGKPSPDSLWNTVGDQVFAMLGWYIASLLLSSSSIL